LTVAAAPSLVSIPIEIAAAIACATFVHSIQNAGSSRRAAQVIGPSFFLRAR
jgi:hypothetical protein